MRVLLMTLLLLGLSACRPLPTLPPGDLPTSPNQGDYAGRPTGSGLEG